MKMILAMMGGFLLGLATLLSIPIFHKDSYSRAVTLAAPNVVNIYTDVHDQKAVLGSGVLMNQQGVVLTNYHVISPVAHIMVALMNGQSAEAQVLGVDPETDLAVLKTPFIGIRSLKIAPNQTVLVGDVVLAIGNPFGLGQTVTQGIVSALGRNAVGLNLLENYIQTDAAINPGNSGGALVNSKGELVGINTAIYTRSGGYQGVGFSIPIQMARSVMQQILKTGSAKRAWLGANVTVCQTGGVLIQSIVKNSPAQTAGLTVDDCITKINEQPVLTVRGFIGDIAQYAPASKVRLVFFRAKKRHEQSIILGQRPSPLHNVAPAEFHHEF